MDAPNTDREITDMTDREIAEETLYWLRTAGKTLAELQNGGIGAMMGQMMRGMVGKK
jgi:hypothetical protein